MAVRISLPQMVHCWGVTANMVQCCCCFRHRFAQVSYLRGARAGQTERVQHTLIFLVEAAAVAQPDDAAVASISDAQAAQARKAAAAEELLAASRALALAQEVRPSMFGAMAVRCDVAWVCTRKRGEGERFLRINKAVDSAHEKLGMRSDTQVSEGNLSCWKAASNHHFVVLGVLIRALRTIAAGAPLQVQQDSPGKLVYTSDCSQPVLQAHNAHCLHT